MQLVESSYPLDGIRSATTGPQEALVLRAVEVLGGDPRILAGYLVGGFAVGQGDAYSDVDLQLLASDDAVGDLAGSWTDLLERIAPPAHVSPFSGAIGGSVITPDWLHYDLVINPASAVDVATVEGMVPLFDKAGLLPGGPVPRPDRQREPFYPEFAVNHFLYMLGNMVSVVGRNEPIPLTNGVILVRDMCLVRLFLAENGWETTREHAFGNPFPFTKRLRSYLDDEQHALLTSLPPVAATVDSGVAGYVALARLFLPRARALAARTGATWPEAYERASVGYFERMLGVSLDLRPGHAEDSDRQRGL
jgi:hypothetical protein